MKKVKQLFGLSFLTIILLILSGCYTQMRTVTETHDEPEYTAEDPDYEEEYDETEQDTVYEDEDQEVHHYHHYRPSRGWIDFYSPPFYTVGFGYWDYYDPWYYGSGGFGYGGYYGPGYYWDSFYCGPFFTYNPYYYGYGRRNYRSYRGYYGGYYGGYSYGYANSKPQNRRPFGRRRSCG